MGGVRKTQISRNRFLWLYGFKAEVTGKDSRESVTSLTRIYFLKAPIYTAYFKNASIVHIHARKQLYSC